MAARFVPVVAATLLVSSTYVIAQPQRPAAPPAGNRIEARDGDTVVVDDDARVKIVRRRTANVRIVFNPAERWAVLLVDYATANGAPDGRVDTTYSYTGINGDWPMEERWEGPATIEDYSTAGEGGPGGMGIAGPRGLVQFLARQTNNEFRDASATATVSFTGSGRGGSIGRKFDETEPRAIAQVRANASRQTGMPGNLSMSMSASSGGIGAGSSGFVVDAVTLAPGGIAPVRVGGNIAPPTKVVDVPPVLPELAQRASVRGVVIVEITIDTDGSVKNPRVLRSIPLLDQAALDAVRQWRYTPTMLNGQAVPVLLTVAVTFE